MYANNNYKSAVSSRFVDGVNGAVLSQDREQKILGGGTFSPTSTYDGMIKDLEALQQKIRTVGSTTGLAGMFYRIGDQLGITSPQKRLLGQRRILETEASRLDRMVKSHSDSIEKLAEEIQEVKGLKRDAKAVKNKYQSMEEQLIAEGAKLSDEKAKVCDELKQLDPKDPKAYAIQKTVDDYALEVDKLEDDISMVGYKMNRAAKAIIKFHNKLKRYEHFKQVLKNTLDALEDGYNKLDLKIDEVNAISANNGSSVISSLTGLKQAHETYDKVSAVIGDAPDEINRALTQISVGLGVPEHFETSRIDQMTSDLKRTSERRESELMRRAEEIERDDLAA